MSNLSELAIANAIDLLIGSGANGDAVHLQVELVTADGRPPSRYFLSVQWYLSFRDSRAPWLPAPKAMYQNESYRENDSKRQSLLLETLPSIFLPSNHFSGERAHEWR